MGRDVQPKSVGLLASGAKPIVRQRKTERWPEKTEETGGLSRHGLLAVLVFILRESGRIKHRGEESGDVLRISHSETYEDKVKVREKFVRLVPRSFIITSRKFCQDI